MKQLRRMILSRTSFILVLLLLQIVLFLFILEYLTKFPYVTWIMNGITFFIVLYLIYKEENPVYKLSWIIPILLFPLFGGIFYLFYRNRNVNHKLLNKFKEAELKRYMYFKDFLTYDKDHLISSYLHETKYFSDYHTKTTYLGSGERMFEAMKKDIKNAKHYILLEFFIIKKGKMWKDLLDILIEKAKENVEVFLIYDDFGSSSLPFRYPKELAKYGIKAYVFNPMRIHLNFAMNYRNHQKIVIVDGKIAYTGGINIGDEYINLEHPFGHWKDAGVKLEGPMVSTLVYSEMLTINFIDPKSTINIQNYIYHDFDKSYTDAMTIAFSDSPMDQELTNKNVYYSMIAQAKKSIYLTTPYLIIDNELKTALKVAAKSGVDIHIIIPYIPDKKLVYMVTESYAEELAKSGITIHRYKKGFIHSKMIVTDKKHAMIGTANLDFRSLYLHFENSVYLENKKTIQAMLDDMENTINQSMILDPSTRKNIFANLFKFILRGFSTIM